MLNKLQSPRVHYAASSLAIARMSQPVIRNGPIVCLGAAAAAAVGYFECEVHLARLWVKGGPAWAGPGLLLPCEEFEE